MQESWDVFRTFLVKLHSLDIENGVSKHYLEFLSKQSSSRANRCLPQRKEKPLPNDNKKLKKTALAIFS